jgi:hypothetical protein
MKTVSLNRYVYLTWVALFWAVANAVYVYLALDGEKIFRVESAAYILVAVLLPLLFWRSSSSGHDAVLSLSETRLLIGCAFGVWLVLVVPHLRLPFLSDDYVFLADYTSVADTFRARQFFRPLFAVVFFLLARAGGGSPALFHIVALLLHTAAAACVYVLGRRLFRRADLAALCLVIFLLNPLQLEALLWVSGLQELLWTVLVLSGLVVYTGETTLSARRLCATVGLLALALCAKETAISSVLLLPAADFLFFRMRRGRLLVVAYVSCVVVAAAYLLARSRFTTADPDFFAVPGKYFAQKFIATPYKFFVQPWNAAAVAVPAVVSCAAATLAFAIAFLSVTRGTGAVALTGPLVILISTLPVYSFFYVAPDLRATRYLYFAAIGWALLVTQMLGTLLQGKKTLTIGAFVGYMVFASACLYVNTRPWRTAGEIVHGVIDELEAGRDPRADAETWRARYGDGIEVKDGIPTVYEGVYLFVNGYPELRAMHTKERAN